MQNLPIGIQTFEDIRRDNYLYVDKTEHVHRIVTSGKVYFLSRPRRFGKSLLISTMKSLFKGDKHLFEGLWIYDKWDWTQTNPVIRLDMSGISNSTEEKIELDMSAFLKNMAKDQDITLIRPFAAGLFSELIEKLHKKTGRQVVILIDEYDSPILETMGTAELPAIQKFLQVFYKQMKVNDEHIRLIFITGVTKVAKLSIFSTLNNPRDITMADEYCALCGLTQEELESYFSEYIDDLKERAGLTREELLSAIKSWYDGYSWDGQTRVYNPFSTLLLFVEKIFTNYWFATGTPTFLIEQLRQGYDIQLVLEPFAANAIIFDSFNPNNINNISLLFQAGYLTVKERLKTVSGPKYTLAVPNNEVRQSMIEYLFSDYSKRDLMEVSNLTQSMTEQINTRDSEGFARNIGVMMAKIPFNLTIENEKYYHSLFLAWMYALGFRVDGEIMTNIGRIDAVMEQTDVIVVTELKYHARKKMETLLNEAMRQIRDRQYYEKYLDRGKPVLLMGLAFSGKKVGCRMEELDN